MPNDNPEAPVVVDVDVVTSPALPGAPDYARDRIGELARLAQRPVLSARVKLSRHGDPATTPPVVAQANINVNGRLVRAEAEGMSAREAIDRLADRLGHRLAGLAQFGPAGGAPASALEEWRHRGEPTHRHAYFPRPAAERRIARHKSVSLRRLSIDDAAKEMALLDYDFHLFTEAGSGQDSMLYRAGPTGYRLARLTPPEPRELAAFDLPVTISDRAAPRLSTADAVDRLELSGLPFLFFVQADCGRGAVVYRRYDGHYGLLAPTGEPT